MAQYFVAGVGRALLFKGETLFADCRTLVDSSITIGVTAEDIRGGEGNALFGQYYHDSSFSMKLTDAMFNLEFIAANVGSALTTGGNIFKYETLTSNNAGELTLSAAPVPVVTNGTAYLWYRKSSEQKDMERVAAPSTTVGGFAANTEYCVMYRIAVEGDVVTINSQFIPDTLHAVLTVALYSGDSCNVEAGTKAGEIVIDIPRFQLTGASDITMSATGAAQTPLEGNALASGCTGCDGKAVYATITRVISGAHWYDDAEGLIIEDLSGIKAGDTVNKNLVVYAYYANKAPKQVAIADLTVTFNGGDTGLSYSAGVISGTAAEGTATINVVATAKPALETNKNVVVAAAQLNEDNLPFSAR